MLTIPEHAGRFRHVRTRNGYHDAMPDAVDPVAAQLIAGAVMHQSELVRARDVAEYHQTRRNAAIRKLRDLDEHTWTYAAIGSAVGLTPVNVVKILKPQPR